ncbi:DUF4917 family protein, partial [Castellaniella caeni]|uniref:DUF4917 family protein n=2 Tax=Castellaniella caeni TaxID=266123 RepID=UPI0011AFCC2A
WKSGFWNRLIQTFPRDENGDLGFFYDKVYRISKINPIAVKLYFLHGGIHLASIYGYDALKLTTGDGDNFKEIIGQQRFDGWQPLFITEGCSSGKLSRIRGNSYLSFCYEALLGATGGLVIFGHSLNKDYDGHVLEAIINSGVSNIYIGVYSDLKKHEKCGLAHQMMSYLNKSDAKIEFFESASHPLGNL